MDATVFSRIAESLKEQRRNLVGWLRSVPQETKAIRLGYRNDGAEQEHLRVLEASIEKADAGELGRCTVCHEFIETHWLETNYTNCVCLEHLNGEERSRLEAELELSQKVQQALLPQSLPTLAGWELAAFSQPASIVGGDYFDFLRFRDGSHAVLIADVMGKGMPASMLMASLQASMHIIVPESTSPGEVLARANRVFYHNINLTKFVSIFVAQIDPDTGVVTYANAGHNPPFVVRKKGNPLPDVVPLRPTGAAVGLVENATFQIDSIHIGHGDMLVMYTDGVVEAANPAREEFGEARLKQFLALRAGSPPGDLIRDLRRELDQVVADRPISDDTTILVCKRTP